MGFERSDRPGGKIAEWQLYEVKVGEGYSNPEGHFFRFTNGEELVHVRNESGSRDTFVRLADGSQIPIKEWEAQNR
jgi:hypothetical protein